MKTTKGELLEWSAKFRESAKRDLKMLGTLSPWKNNKAIREADDAFFRAQARGKQLASHALAQLANKTEHEKVEA